MSTQHPDNVTTPFFSDSDILSGEAEVKEAFFVFSQLGCQEQMWDSEGKEVDNQVVEKLLSRYPDFFNRHPIGKDFYITYRVPNPTVEKNQGKILLEALHSIPRAYDVAKAAGFEDAPIFEVILPMTTSHLEPKRVKNYYKEVIVGQQDFKFGTEKITLREWVGEFKPERISVIPLVENYDSILHCDKIMSNYLKGKKYEYQRVFLARSDPALNYGSTVAVLLSKLALQKLQSVEEETSIPIYPIIGVGGAPFRGNFTPNNVNNCGDEYPSVQTFTAQSSFKYDHPSRDVVNAVDMLNHGRRREPLQIEEKNAVAFMGKLMTEYEHQLKEMAELINGVSVFVPGRRARKLHVGLFGYSRSMKGIKMPRAIKFCAAFYSIGIPPELLGLSALSNREFDDLHGLYTKIDDDLKDAVKFLNPKNLNKMPGSVKKGINKVLGWLDFEPDEEYVTISSRVLDNFNAGKHTGLAEDIKALAWKRKFLG
jgi:phosphoenolpyruvate carboxylase